MMDHLSTFKLTYRFRITVPKTQSKIEGNEFMLIAIEDKMKFTKILKAWFSFTRQNDQSNRCKNEKHQTENGERPTVS